MRSLWGAGRRDFVRTCGMLAAGLASGGWTGVLPARAADPDPEVPPEAAPMMRALFGDRPIRRGHVEIDMPALAEDSRVVPVLISCDLPMTPGAYVRNLTLIADYNPVPLVFAWELTPDLGAVSLSTRIKMRRTSWVRAIAETSGGELWAGYARVKITLDGCA